jgi:hypothetical protein
VSSYRPEKQGRRDAREGKPRYPHRSAWNQEIYNRAYDQELRRIAERPPEPEPVLTPQEWCADNGHMLDALSPADIVEAWEEYRQRREYR